MSWGDQIVQYFTSIRWDDVNTIGAILIVFGVISFTILERFFPYTQGLPVFRKGYWIDLVWYTFIQSYFLKILIFDWIIAPAEFNLKIAENGYISHWPVWLLVLFFFITHDFYIYWFHRWQHSNKWLWRTHEAHHSVEQVDFLAGSRSHALEIVINQTIEFLPIFFLLDVQTAALVYPIKGTMDALWGQFIHSNLNVKLGKLGYVINGPEHHQWHHADHIEVYHANFATKLAIWDWLFGTMYLPDKKPQRFGLWYQFPRDYFMQHLFSVIRFDVKKVENHPLIRWYINLRITLLNFIKAIFQRTFRWKKIKQLHPGNIYPKLDITRAQP